MSSLRAGETFRDVFGALQLFIKTTMYGYSKTGLGSCCALGGLPAPVPPSRAEQPWGHPNPGELWASCSRLGVPWWSTAGQQDWSRLCRCGSLQVSPTQHTLMLCHELGLKSLNQKMFTQCLTWTHVLRSHQPWLFRALQYC